MKVKTTVTLGLRVVVLTLILFAFYSINFLGLRLIEGVQISPAMRLLVCFLHTVVLSYVIVRSRWAGWRLTLAIFFVFYGVTWFQSLIEAVVFLQYLTHIMPAEAFPGLFLNGAISAALFSPLAVLIHGRMREDKQEQQPNLRLVMPWTKWVWKLIVIGIIYVAVYLSFGMFVFQPLAGEAFGEYYGDLQLPGWFFPFQIMRGIIWAALALPVIRMMRGRWWEAGLAVALLFSVLMGSQLLEPEEFMPKAIRMAHLVETFSSNFLFGWILVLVLNRHH